MLLLEKVSGFLKNINKKWLIGILAAIAIILTVILILLLVSPATEPPEPEIPTTEEPTAPYSASDFAIDQNGFLSCLSENYALGIDVSKFQGEIDWPTVKDAGVEFVFIRVGGRGTSEGALYADDYAATYYEGAKAAGLQIGAYFFSQAINPEEAVEEACFALEQIIGWELDLPIVFDWEWVSDDARTADLSREVLTDSTIAFCEMIKTAGYEPAIYFNAFQGHNQLDMDKLQDYKLWLAYYDRSPNFPRKVDFWQYSCTGTVPGITGDVDMNIWFLPES